MSEPVEALQDGRARLPKGQFLTERFPVLTYGPTPAVTTDDWKMRVWGSCLSKEITCDWKDFTALGSHETTRDFHCVTTWSRYDNTWGGVSVGAVWDWISGQVGAGGGDLSKVAAVMLHCYGDYTTNLLIDDFLAADNLFATHHDGVPLSAPHGGPMRFVCHHLYAWKSAKWINGIELLTEVERGFWEVNGYHIRGNPWSEERYAYQE